MRRALPVLLLALVAAGCTASEPTPAPASAAPASAAPVTSSAAATPVPSAAPAPTDTTTPAPLPPIPADPVPGEVVRSTFSPGEVRNGSATHRFSGRPVTVHIICAEHQGMVDVELWVDGARHNGATTSCEAPHFIEDASFGQGDKRVELRVQPSAGASGVAYVTDGEI